jgi:hypothetical protein
MLNPTPDDDYHPYDNIAKQGQIIEIPNGTKLVVVNHWDWPFAWIMSIAFSIGIVILLWAGRRK